MNSALLNDSGQSYRLASRLYLERFGDEALLLVADHERLLTINAAAAELFEMATVDFMDRPVTIDGIANWLARSFDLPLMDCRSKSRELLAFALCNHLLHRSAPT